MKKPPQRPTKPASPAPPQDVVRFACACGAALRIPAWRVDGRGVCPKCRRRILLAGKAGPSGATVVHPLVLGQEDPSGRTFLIDDAYRIEDHFREIPEAQDKIAFFCPCGFKLHARPAQIDKRGKCPECGARLLLVGKTNPRTRKLEIHPLVIDDATGTGDTQTFEG
jgi:DNA-directed RNA polymerase subunit RPC12/RpoP